MEARMMEKVSVIICTFNRPDDLREALESIYHQTSPPIEVLVVDDSTTDQSRKIILDEAQRFANKSISLRHIRNYKDRGTTVARNIGAFSSKGSIIQFIDDDVILDKDYLKVILDLYRDHPNAMGAHAFIHPTVHMSRWKRFTNSIDRMFFLQCRHNDCGGVTRSFNPVVPAYLNGTIKCQWLNGCNLSCRREVFEHIRFDENLKRYAYGEDLDFSYRLWRIFPGSLYMTPDAHLVHKMSGVSRLPPKELSILWLVNHEYLFRKNFEQTIMNRAIFHWSEFGKILTDCLQGIKKRSMTSAVWELSFAVKALGRKG